MGSTSLQKLASAAAGALLIVTLPRPSMAAGAIFNISDVVTAGEPTNVQANFTTPEKEGQNVNCAGPDDCYEFEYFQLYLETDPQFDSKTVPTDPATVNWSPYCKSCDRWSSR
jgi:hypothetical protein